MLLGKQFLNVQNIGRRFGTYNMFKSLCLPSCHTKGLRKGRYDETRAVGIGGGTGGPCPPPPNNLHKYAPPPPKKKKKKICVPPKKFMCALSICNYFLRAWKPSLVKILPTGFLHNSFFLLLLFYWVFIVFYNLFKLFIF